MAEMMTFKMKCCCQAELEIHVEAYRREWMESQIEKFSKNHVNCPEKKFENPKFGIIEKDTAEKISEA